jgi:RNA polymerase sigma-70 factor (ECF subfamily)
MDETQLINRALHGNLDAFDQLVLAYQDMAYFLAYRILDDADAAADAAQMAFIAAYCGLAGYRGGSFKAWLMRMVTNICYDEVRRRRRKPTVAIEPVDSRTSEEVESPAWLADRNPAPEQQVEMRELAVVIQDCIQKLPLEFRAIVILVDVQGFDYSETSQAVGRLLGTVKSRLARARLRLRECLGSDVMETGGYPHRPLAVPGGVGLSEM